MKPVTIGGLTSKMEFLIKNVYSIVFPSGIVPLINYFYLVYLVLVSMSITFTKVHYFILLHGTAHFLYRLENTNFKQPLHKLTKSEKIIKLYF